MWLAIMLACTQTVPPAAPKPDQPVKAEKAKPAPKEFSFEALPLTDDLLVKKVPTSTLKATINGKEVAIDYRILGRQGENGFGQLFDQSGKPIKEECNEQDFNSLLLAKGHPWLISHFECAPGEIYLTRLLQDDKGMLKAEWSKPADFKKWGGLWNPCAGQVSPWGTHIGSEEYEPDASSKPTSIKTHGWNYVTYQQMLRYTEGKDFNPYLYGWTPELTITDADGGHSTVKHFAPGRFSHEIAYTLPDQRTVYMSDDGSRTGYFMFVTDKPADLSSGKLYAARWHQEGKDAGRISWVPMGHATDGAISGLIDAGVTFKDLFETATPDGQTCPSDFRFVHAQGKKECLKLKLPSKKVANPSIAASRLETRRYAAYLGATTEFEKGEGVTYDPGEKIVYLVTSKVRRGMVASKLEKDVVDHMQLPENNCGAVLAGHTVPSAKDAAGKPIDSDFVIARMDIALQGTPLAEPDAQGNKCSVDNIANPDNITFLPGYNILMLGEDSGSHVLNALWAHNTRTKENTRVMVSPRYGEVTGLHWIPDLNGFGYLTVAIQHPWEVESLEKVNAPEGITIKDMRSFTGVLGPFPRLK